MSLRSSVRRGDAMSLRAVVVVLALLGGIAGCDAMLGPTKTAHGELYQSGDGRYDGYFSAVHQEQVAGSHWREESTAARKPVITTLHLRAGASNGTILSAARDAREKKSEPGLGGAIEQTIAAEQERARKLTAAAAKLDELKKQGDEHKKQIDEDRKNAGADRADEKKVAKRNELRKEMTAAVDAVESLASDARDAAKEAEELATKLRAIASGKEPAPEPVAKKAPAEDKKPAPKKPPPAEDKKPAPKPAPAEEKKPAPKPDEVFNP